MECIDIKIYENERLSKALDRAGYKNIPSNAILDKTLTGIGATYMEIKAERPSIILEPNVPVIKGKVESNPECLGVYKGIHESKIRNYLQDKLNPRKKILTTPESFAKIKSIAKDLGINLFEDYFCLFDECEKISQDYEFRNSIAFPIKDFFNFKSKAFVSATPVGMAGKAFENNGFKTYKIKPVGFDHKVDLELITTNVFMRCIAKKLQTLFDNLSTGIFVFYNSIRGIREIIDQFKIPVDKYAVFCSDNRFNELKTLGYNVQKQATDSTIKQINFLTSRYYSAVDFSLSICPDIVMMTNQSIASHSRIDPLSEAIQIQGRFRNVQSNGKRINSLCHISDLVNTDFLTPEQIDETLQSWYKTAKDLKVRYDVANSKTERKAILHEYQQSRIFPYLDTPDLESDFRINIFSVLNKHYVERIKSVYSESQKLIQAYSTANYFNLIHIDAFDYTLTLGKLDIPLRKINKKTSQKDQIQAILSQLRLGVEPEQILTLLKDVSIADLYVNATNVIEAVQLLGADVVGTKTTFNAIEKILEPAKKFKISEEKRFSAEVILKIKNEFEADMNTPVSKEQIKLRLEKIYCEYSFIKTNGNPFAITKSTIEDYFEFKSNNEKRTYTLSSLLPGLAAKIQQKNDLTSGG